MTGSDLRAWMAWRLLAMTVALAWLPCRAQEQLPWRQQLQASYTGASQRVDSERAAATTAQARETALRHALQLQDLYRRYRELEPLLREAQGQPGLAGEGQLYRARIQMGAGHLAEAARTLEPLRRQFVRLPEGELRQEVRLTLAMLDLQLGQREEATRELNQLIATAQQAGQPELAARAYSALGDVQLEMFDYATGLGYHRQALQLAPDWAVQTREQARMGMAQMINMVGERREAFALLDTALAAFRRSQNLRAEADGLLLRGFFLHRDHQAMKALEPYRLALALREQLGGDADIVNVLTHLCSTLADVKQTQEALALCERATRMADATDNEALRWDSHWVMAEVLAAAGDYRPAYEHQQLATRALQKHARQTLISQTGAMRERFDAERQRLDNETLTARLGSERDAHDALHKSVYALGALCLLLLAGLAALLWRRRAPAGSVTPA
jgi:tetratricopeptide (TPR) repeat protein